MTTQTRTFTPDQVASGIKARVNELAPQTMLDRIREAIRGCGAAFEELCIPFENDEPFRENSVYLSLCSFSIAEDCIDEILVMFKTAPIELRHKEQFLNRRWHYVAAGNSKEKVLKYRDTFSLVDNAFVDLLQKRPELLHQILKRLQAAPGEKARIHEERARTFRNMQTLVGSTMANIDFA